MRYVPPPAASRGGGGEMRAVLALQILACEYIFARWSFYAAAAAAASLFYTHTHTRERAEYVGKSIREGLARAERLFMRMSEPKSSRIYVPYTGFYINSDEASHTLFLQVLYSCTHLLFNFLI